jgi:predicted dehydrogenase
MQRHAIRRRVSRRSFLQSSSATTALAAAVPGGVFAGGSDRLRVGLVGCGGRGTAAAIHALTATGGVEVVAVGDRVAEQVAAAAAAVESIAAGCGSRPVRCVGDDAAELVLSTGVDIVILATPPHLRPAEAAAAIRAGVHVYCEPPVAVDAAGVRSLLAVGAEARARGLSFVAGFESRHHPGLAAAVRGIRDGVVGRPTRGVAVAELGLPWRLPRRADWSAAEHALRNWISEPRFSGGPLVEHHVHAVDRMLWAFGDEPPVSVAAVRRPAPLPAPCHAAEAVAVTYRFRDGRTLEAGIERREGIVTRVEELVEGPGGRVDLRAARFAAPGVPAAVPEAAVRTLVTGLRAGRRIDDLQSAARSTLAAILGRDAVAAGHSLAWPAFWPAVEAGSSQSVQSSTV